MVRDIRWDVPANPKPMGAPSAAVCTNLVHFLWSLPSLVCNGDTQPAALVLRHLHIQADARQNLRLQKLWQHAGLTANALPTINRQLAGCESAAPTSKMWTFISESWKSHNVVKLWGSQVQPETQSTRAVPMFV